MGYNNLEMQQKEKLIEVPLSYTELFTSRPEKCKVHVKKYKFTITNTIPITGYSIPSAIFSQSRC
jgi:hypothetical protein